MDEIEERYQCVGICMTDPDTGHCLGCGRPPEPVQEVIVEVVKPCPGVPAGNDDNPLE